MDKLQNLIHDKEFLAAGKAVFIAENNKGEKHIFSIRRKDGKTRYFGKHFTVFYVKHKTGNSWWNGNFLGCYNPQENLLVTTGKAIPENSVESKIFRFCLRIIDKNQRLPEGYKLNHAGSCCRCGKELTDDKSRLYGVGPHCIKYMSKEYLSKIARLEKIKEILK